MLKSALVTRVGFVLLTLLLAASANSVFAEWGEVELSLDPHDIIDTKAFSNLVVNLEAGGMPDGTLNAVTISFDAPTTGYSSRSVYLEITCYDPSIRGLPQTEGRTFPGHAIRLGKSQEPGLFCPNNMRMVKAYGAASLDSP